MEQVFANARVVTPERDFIGSVRLVDGEIVDVDEGPAAPPSALNFSGDYLLPGLIDLHTDNLEKHYMPRPDVTWDSVGAAVAHDAQMAASGITTVYDALSVRGASDTFDRREHLSPMLDGLCEASKEGLLRADHKLHLRCEVSNPGLEPELAPHLDHPLLALISVMDHTPGQRQYRNMTDESFAALLAKYERSEEEIAKAMAAFRAREAGHHIAVNREFVARSANSRGVPYASHDDETPEHVAEALEEGASIAEFPVTMDAALHSREQGMSVVMGAPNLLRGGSHSGNVSVADVAQAGSMDALASDYLPLSLLRSAFLLASAPFNWPVARAVNTVTAAPAHAACLDDRGRIETGHRGDLIRVRVAQNGWPQVHGVWVKGDRVA